MVDYSLEDTTCKTCGDEFEEGDGVYAVWGGDAVQGDRELEMRADMLDFHHRRCAGVEDQRDPVARRFAYTNADGVETVHFVKPTGYRDDVGDTYCGRVEVDPEEVEEERVSPHRIDPGKDGVCNRCASTWRRKNR